jgi:hypothetical protein
LRTTEQLLESHAVLWLTPLTGLDPEAFEGTWDVLDQADRVLQARLEESGDVGQDEPLWRIASLLGLAHMNAAEGNFYQVTVPLAICESVAAGL